MTPLTVHHFSRFFEPDALAMVLQLISRAFHALARALTQPTGKVTYPMYDTSFFMIFRARHNGDGPAADFPRFPALARALTQPTGKVL